MVRKPFEVFLLIRDFILGHYYSNFSRSIPESIRWYMTHDKVEKAEVTLQKIAEVNKTKYPNEHLSVPETATVSLGFLALFSTCSLTISALVQAFAW